MGRGKKDEISKQGSTSQQIHLKTVDVEYFEELPIERLLQYSPKTLGNLSVEILARLPPAALERLSPEKLEELPSRPLARLPPETLMKLSPAKFLDVLQEDLSLLDMFTTEQLQKSLSTDQTLTLPLKELCRSLPGTLLLKLVNLPGERAQELNRMLYPATDSTPQINDASVDTPDAPLPEVPTRAPSSTPTATTSMRGNPHSYPSKKCYGPSFEEIECPEFKFTGASSLEKLSRWTAHPKTSRPAPQWWYRGSGWRISCRTPGNTSPYLEFSCRKREVERGYPRKGRPSSTVRQNDVGEGNHE